MPRRPSTKQRRAVRQCRSRRRPVVAALTIVFPLVLIFIFVAAPPLRILAATLKSTDQQSEDNDDPLPCVGDLPKVDAANNVIVTSVNLPSDDKGDGGGMKKGGDRRRRGIMYHYEPLLPPYNEDTINDLVLISSAAASDSDQEGDMDEEEQKERDIKEDIDSSEVADASEGSESDNVKEDEQDGAIEGSQTAAEVADTQPLEQGEAVDAEDVVVTIESSSPKAIGNVRDNVEIREAEEQESSQLDFDAVSQESTEAAEEQNRQDEFTEDDTPPTDDDAAIPAPEKGVPIGGVKLVKLQSKRDRGDAVKKESLPIDDDESNALKEDGSDTSAGSEERDIAKEQNEEEEVVAGSAASDREDVVDEGDDVAKEEVKLLAKEKDRAQKADEELIHSPDGKSIEGKNETYSTSATGSGSSGANLLDKAENSDRIEAEDRVAAGVAGVDEIQDGSTDSRRFAEEKGLPTNLDDKVSADVSADTRDSNTTEAVSDSDTAAVPFEDEDEEEDSDAQPNKLDKFDDADDSIETEDVSEDAGSLSPNGMDKVEELNAHEPELVEEPTELIDASAVVNDRAAWRGIYDREIAEDAPPTISEKSKGEERQGIEDGALNVDVLDNVKEYVASEGVDDLEILQDSFAVPAKGLGREENKIKDAVDIADEERQEERSEDKAVDAEDQQPLNNVEGSDEVAAPIQEGDNGYHPSELQSEGSAVPDEDMDEPVAVDDDISADIGDIQGERSRYIDNLDIDTEPPIDSATMDMSSSSSNVNADFINGIDDLHKFLEEADPPDELDVAHGTSMQEVLMSKGVQITVKKVSTAVKHIRSVASKAKTRIGNSKLVRKIREGIETSGVNGLGEKVRERFSLSEGGASKLQGKNENKEKDVGFGRKVRNVIDEKVENVKKFFERIGDNGKFDQVKVLFDRIKHSELIARIRDILGLGDEDDEGDEDGLMDFASFQRMGGNGASGEDGTSLQERLAAIREQAAAANAG